MSLRFRVVRAFCVALGLLLLMLLVLAYVVRGPIVSNAPRQAQRRPVSADRLERTVKTLCTELTPRWYTPQEDMDRAADWIAGRFRETGLAVVEQRYRLMEGEYRNVIATRHGSEPDRPAIVVGAHYDAYGKYPGADDNASGVAVLLELARTLPEAPPRRTQVFVAFANEEPPLFATEDMGSYHFVREFLGKGEKLDLMIALDLVGYFSNEPGSQNYPVRWLRLFFPSKGDFIAVVGDLRSGASIGRVKRDLRSAGGLPVVSFRGPRVIPGVDWSDHYWFRRFDLPAVLVTDTAMLRNPNYHRHTDLPETLDYVRMAEVVQGLHSVLQDE